MKNIEKNARKQREHWEKGVDTRKGGITGEGRGSVSEEGGRRIQLGLSR